MQRGGSGWVQPPGSEPGMSREEDTRSYGVRLFLLAGG